MRSVLFQQVVRPWILVLAGWSGLAACATAPPAAPAPVTAAPSVAAPPVAPALDILTPSWVEFTSPHDVPTTVRRLEATIAARGAVHFMSIDHAAGARSVDLPLGPMTLVIFGNPKVGSQLMAADPRIGSELPLRVLVWQAADGATRVGFTTPLSLRTRFQPGEHEKLLGAMHKAMTSLVETAIATE